MVYRIFGRVVDSQSGAGVSGLRVEAWDKAAIFDDLLGDASTDGEGAFEIVFEESFFRKIFGDLEPDLYFKVFYTWRRCCRLLVPYSAFRCGFLDARFFVGGPERCDVGRRRPACELPFESLLQMFEGDQTRSP